MQYTSREVYEYISKHNNDPIVEWKICTVSGQPFAIFQSDVDFYEKISPVFLWKKFMIPTPTLCPEERQRRRLMFRNERKLYKRKCDATGDTIVSIYSPDKPYKVYEEEYRKSDKRDEVWIDIDYNESIFNNIQNLYNLTPKCSLYTWSKSENSRYNNFTGSIKDCYLVFDSMDSECCLYSSKTSSSKNCIDCLQVFSSENCYNSIDCYQCFEAFSSQDCKDCHHVINCSDCIWCSYCINSSWLRNRHYCINNEQYSADEYKNKIKAFDINICSNNYIKPSTISYNCEWMIVGNFITESKNILFSFDGVGLNNCRYCCKIQSSSDCGDIDSWWDRSSLLYEGTAIGTKSHTILFCNCCRSSCTNIYYSSHLSGCSDCFWCIWLRNKSYCIFNKQYTKNEYEKTVANIIIHMQETGERWEFFHPSLSPFGYNETVANEYFPLSKQEAIVRWYKWQDKTYDPIIPEGAKVIDFRHPERSEGSSKQQSLDSSLHSEWQADDILKAIFVCEISGRPYRIIKQELEFYRKHNLPLPRRHPDIRHEERMNLRPGRTLYLRNCDKCTKEMLSVYDPKEFLLGDDTKYEWKVYCESCYQQEVYA